MLSPETTAEQVMWYVVWASELIPTLKPSLEKTYSVAMLPQGPLFYTGLLQAAGCLLLNSQKKKLFLISQQSDDKKNILIDTNDYGPILGKKRKKTLTTINAITRSLCAKKSIPEQKSIREQIERQLPFFRVIMDCDEIVHISIGVKYPQNQIKKICNRINTHISEYNIVMFTNIESSGSMKKQKSDEQKQLAKIIKTPSLTNHLLMIFQKILESEKKQPEIVAYVNPGDFGASNASTTRYICAIG